MSARYLLGIDLGTTNSVLAFVALDTEPPQVELLEVPQLVAASTVEGRTSLPSFLYLATDHEAMSGAFDVPWAADRRYGVGDFARASPGTQRAR